MLAVASPPAAPFQFENGRPTPPVFGPLKPTNGGLSNNLDDLLKHPLEFKQGCLTPTSGVLSAGITEGKYKPINDGSVSEDEDQEESLAVAPSPSKKPLPKENIFDGTITLEWPKGFGRHRGFNNLGNTCFLNSVLQCLLHTPPLLTILLDHEHKADFCMICLLRALSTDSFVSGKRGTGMVLNNMNKIAKGMRRGRQEDAHEFLRYSIDALQRSTLAIYSSTSSMHKNPSKIPPALAETSWVHAIFGGRLRSRVSCRTCGHCSDTFDSILDLSVDIARSQSLNQALNQFIKSDILSGEDAYRCEKCKKPVTAEKFMRIHEAPACLTIHLKRFRPDGRKNATAIGYPEVLDIQRCMSEGQTSKRYMLYGVIHHLGSGPSSGHYTAHVKGADGLWTLMDDEVVTPCWNTPVNHKNAYVLFYIQSDKLPSSDPVSAPEVFTLKRTRDEMERSGPRVIRNIPWDISPSNKKSRVENSTEQLGVAGPSKPPPAAISRTTKPLVGYTDSDDIEDAGEIVTPKPTSPTTPKSLTTPTRKPSTPISIPRALSPIPSKLTSVPASNFYGQTKGREKEKRPGSNPYSALAGPGNLHAKKDQLELNKQMGFTNFGNGKVKNRMKGKAA